MTVINIFQKLEPQTITVYQELEPLIITINRQLEDQISSVNILPVTELVVSLNDYVKPVAEKRNSYYTWKYFKSWLLLPWVH
jgi:hypothetical protein